MEIYLYMHTSKILKCEGSRRSLFITNERKMQLPVVFFFYSYLILFPISFLQVFPVLDCWINWVKLINCYSFILVFAQRGKAINGLWFYFHVFYLLPTLPEPRSLTCSHVLIPTWNLSQPPLLPSLIRYIFTPFLCLPFNSELPI